MKNTSIDNPVRIVVTEYPKSGGSWVVNLIGDALHLPKRDIYDVRNEHKAFDLAKHPWYKGMSYPDLPDVCVIKSHELPDSSFLSFPALFIHLIRDGRDVVVSKYFYEKEFCVRNLIYQSFEMSFDEYVPKIAKEWSEYVLAWRNTAAHSCRYEDFLQAPSSTLRKVLDEIKCPSSETRIEYAIAANTKEKMKQSLAKTFRYNTFVRKGISGDWRNHFNESHVNMFKEFAGDALIRTGYEKDFEWDL